MDTGKKMTLRIPPEIHEKLKMEAKVQNRSIHNLILTIIMHYFANKP